MLTQQFPPSPTQPPFFQLLEWILNPIKFMEESAQQYGDIFTVYLSSQKPVVMISHPEFIEKMFNPNLFDAPGTANKIMIPLLGPNALMCLDGEKHQRERQLLMPSFHGERMRYYGDKICNITQEVMNDLKVNQSFTMRSVAQEITLRVILHAVFGMDSGTRLERLKPLFTNFLDLSSSPLKSSLLFIPWLQKDLGPWSPWGQFQQLKRGIDEILYEEIRERRLNPDPEKNDILSLMMAARDPEGQGMSNEELRDELMTLLLAGHETTATAIAWAFYWIYQDSSIQEKLLEELEKLPENVDNMAIFRLPYLTAICQETLRIYPVGILTFPRVVRSPVTFKDYELAPGTTVLASVYLTHHREDIYPQPLQFKPERFLEKTFSPSEYLPFGGGARRCIGMALALLEMKLVVATILRHYHLFLLEEKLPKVQRRGFTSTPSTGIRMKLLNFN